MFEFSQDEVCLSHDMKIKYAKIMSENYSIAYNFSSAGGHAF